MHITQSNNARYENFKQLCHMSNKENSPAPTTRPRKTRKKKTQIQRPRTPQ